MGDVLTFPRSLVRYALPCETVRQLKAMRLAALIDLACGAIVRGDEPAAFAYSADAQKAYEDLHGDPVH